MADFNQPSINSLYVDMVDTLKNRDNSCLQWLDGTSDTGLPSGAKRWNSTNSYFEKFNGTAWSPLAAKYMIDVDKVDGCTVNNSGTATTDLWTASKITNMLDSKVTANASITAGTYKSVTVDTKGLVTGGTNPTTLAGYGITDALSITGKAADSELLDGRDSKGYLYKTGTGSVNNYGFNVNSDNNVMLGYYNSGWKNTLEMNGTASTLKYYDSAGSAKTIWNSGYMGAGSGLDADKLDNVEGAMYLQAKSIGNDNLNTLTTRGMYRFETPTGTPTSGASAETYGNVLVVKGSDGGTGDADTLGHILFNYNQRNHYIRGGSNSTIGTTPWDLMYTNANLGALLGFTFISRYISSYTDSADITSYLQTALNNNKVVYLDTDRIAYIDGTLEIPQGVRLTSLAPATFRGTTQLRIGPNGVINPRSHCVIEGLGISKMSDSSTFNGVGTLASGGVAIQTTSVAVTDVHIINNFITGFNIGIDTVNGGASTGTTRGRWHISGNTFDNNTDVRLGYCLDNMYFKENHKWPFLGSPVKWTGSTITGTPRYAFIEINNQYVDWLQVTNCFSHSTNRYIAGYFSGVCIGGGYDLEDYRVSASSSLGATKVGINIQNASTASRGSAQVIGTRFNGGEIHIRANFDSSDNNIAHAVVSGVVCKGATYTFFTAQDTNADVPGGGLLTISGADCSNIGGTATTKYIATASNTAKINIVGITRPTTVAQVDYYKDAGAVIQVTGEMTY